MKLVISIDVEEEGLFSGHYPRSPGVTNVAALKRLEFIPREFGLPLSLLVTHRVVQDPAACEILARWRDVHRAEIGAHLHPWSTPPFQEMSLREPVPPEQLPTPILREKFANLVAEVWRSLGVKPTSFRAGRFEVGPKALGLLPEFGFKVDSSVAPLTLKGGDDYFLAPADPFHLTQTATGKPPLLEAPLTLVPLISLLPRALARLAPRLSLSAGRRLLSCFQYLGAAGIQPAWFSLPSMRLAAALHRSRGGRVLTMFFHSTELLPGGNRLFPSETAVAGFVGKIRAFLNWLVRSGPVEGVTLSGLYHEWVAGRLPLASPECSR
ncbi:MAG: hypothetical protein ACLQUW_04280 [Desulfobaccales bacterium]